VQFPHKSLRFLSILSYVKRRNDKVIQAAARSNAIVSSLFPSNVRDRLFKAEDEKAKDQTWNPKTGLKSYLRDDGGVNAKDVNFNDSKPLADLFPETTIMVRMCNNFALSNLFPSSHSTCALLSLVCRYRRLHCMEFRPRTHTSVCFA
jgi:hypothetical protein